MKQSSHGLATFGMKTLAWSTSPPLPAGGSTNGPYRTVVCRTPAAGSAPARPPVRRRLVADEQVPRWHFHEGHVHIAGRGAGHRRMDLGHGPGDLGLQPSARTVGLDGELIEGHAPTVSRPGPIRANRAI